MRRKLVLSDNAIEKARKWVSDRAQIEKLHQGQYSMMKYYFEL